MLFFLNQTVRLFKYFIYWMIFFWLAKAFFLLSNLDQSHHLSFTEIAGIFIHGLKMDISTACYILLLPGLFLISRAFLPSRFINRLIRIFTMVVVSVASFLIAIDLGLYPHWGTRVNVTAFNYIGDPVAMTASVSIGNIIVGLLITGSLITGFIFLYKWFFPKGIVHEGRIRWHVPFLQLVLLGSLIIPIRGGFDTSPLNLSSAAFSPKKYVNQAATNYLWNFGKSVLTIKRFSNPCDYMTAERSIRVFNDFLRADIPVKRPKLIRENPAKLPNVILIILESISDKVIAPLGGMHGIAPNLDSLCTKSTVFTSFYSTGNRSDRGISALLGGYPSLLSTSIMVYPEKSNSLTLLPEYFERKDYNTSFYYGGDINFYNLKAFVLQGKYDRLVSKPDFPAEYGRMSKWGVPDGFVFEKALEDLKTEKEPFMKTIYTISSHPPYDVPFSKIRGSSNQDRYLNSAAYTDSCLGVFIDGFRKSPFWENTLLIVTSDHGTMQPGPTDITDPASYAIPLIWSGGVLDSVQRIGAITMQSDFTPSLVLQLGWVPDSSRFSKDFFVSRPFAFYMLEAGWGYIIPEGNFYYDRDLDDFVNKPGPGDKYIDLAFPQAFMQVLHDDFIRK